MSNQVASVFADEMVPGGVEDGVITADRAERITLFNTAAEQLTGWTTKQALGKPLMQVFHVVYRESGDPVADPAAQALTSRAVVELSNETVLITRDSTRKYISGSVVPVCDNRGDAAGVAVIFRDVTRMREAEEALRETLELSRNLIDSSLDMIIAVDGDRRISEFNVAAQKTFGYTREEVLGRDASLLYSDQVEASRVQNAMAEDGHLAQEVRNRRKNGEIFPAFLSASRLKDAQGQPIGVMGVSRDITELKKTEEQTIRAERLAALGQMSAALAHEINNPLQAIRSILDLVLDFPLGVEERENNLNIIRQEIERLSEVTGRVVNFARPARVPRRPASVADILRHTLTLAGKHLQHSHVLVDTDLPELAPVLVAPEQMAQVFLNLILNAIEEMHAGGNLKIALRDEGQNAAVTFANDGPAIPPDVMPHIFDPFFTTKPDGSGLGLSVSASLVQQQGGTIIAENLEQGRGVIFTVRLPFAPDAAAETTQ